MLDYDDFHPSPLDDETRQEEYTYEQLLKYPKSPLEIGDIIHTVELYDGFFPDLVPFPGVFKLIDFRKPKVSEKYLYQDQFTPEHFITKLAPFHKNHVRPARIMDKPSEYNYRVLRMINDSFSGNSYFIVNKV